MISKLELLDKIEKANSNDEYLRIVRKYIIHGIPFVFKDNPELIGGIKIRLKISIFYGEKVVHLADF